MHSPIRVDVITLASPPPTLQPLPAPVAQQAAARWWSSTPDSGLTHSFHVTSSDSALSFSRSLCVTISISQFLYLSWSLCSNLRGTLAHPQQAESCPTEHHRTPRITLKRAAYSGFWQLNYGWNACSLSLGCWGWSGDVTLTTFRVFLGLRKYSFVKYSWDVAWTCSFCRMAQAFAQMIFHTTYLLLQYAQVF